MGEIFRTDIDLLLFSRSVNSEIYVVIGCVEIFKRFFIFYSYYILISRKIEIFRVEFADR